MAPKQKKKKNTNNLCDQMFFKAISHGTSSALPIALFRVIFGFLAFNSMMEFMKSGVLEFNYNPHRPTIRFYFDLTLILPNLALNVEQLRTLCWLLCGGCAAISIGIKANLSAMLVCLVNTYLLIMDRAFYTNARYLISLFAFLLAITQCDAAFCAGRNNLTNTVVPRKGKPARVPLWNLKILQFQACAILLFSALAKWTCLDWMLLGEPLLYHVNSASSEWWVPVVDFLSARNLVPYSSHVCLAVVMLETIIAVGLLLGIQKSFCLSLLFFYEILVYLTVPSLKAESLLLMASGCLFLNEGPLEWAWNLLSYINYESFAWSESGGTSVDRTAPKEDGKEAEDQPVVLPSKMRPNPLTLSFLLFYVAWQIYLPVKSISFSSTADLQWSNHGSYFSWRPKGLVRDDVLFRVIHKVPQGFVSLDLYRSPLNFHQVSRMASDPEMLVQLAHMTYKFSKKGEVQEVRLDAWRSVNGRPFMRWTNVNVNLAAKKWMFDFEALLEGGLVTSAVDDGSLADQNYLDMVRRHYAGQNKNVTIFAGKKYDMLADVTLGSEDLPSSKQCSSSEVTLAVVLGKISVVYMGAPDSSKPSVLSEKEEVTIKPQQTHTIHAKGDGYSIWLYSYSCPEGAFHTYAGITSKAGWREEFPASTLSLSSWSMDQGLYPRQ